MTPFFTLVRFLERSVGLDRVRFSHASSFAFPASDVADVQQDTDGTFHVTTTFLGLAGSESPLPAAMSEELLFGDEAGHLQAFYDVFHDQALRLLYEAWKRFSPGLEGTESPFRRELLSLVGVDAFSPFLPAMAGEGSFDLGLSDFTRCDPDFLNEAGLQAILERAYPHLRPRVAPGDAREVEADAADRTWLGERGSVMGIDANFGGSGLDTQGSLRVTLGPVDAATYEALMPGGAQHGELAAFLDHWTASRVRLELDVLVEAGELPDLCLGDGYGASMGREARFGAASGAALCVRVPLERDGGEAARRYVHE